LRLAALWTMLMCFYAYTDLIGFFDAKLMGQILAGNMGPFGPISEELLEGEIAGIVEAQRELLVDDLLRMSVQREVNP